MGTWLSPHGTLSSRKSLTPPCSHLPQEPRLPLSRTPRYHARPAAPAGDPANHKHEDDEVERGLGAGDRNHLRIRDPRGWTMGVALLGSIILVGRYRCGLCATDQPIDLAIDQLVGRCNELILSASPCLGEGSTSQTTRKREREVRGTDPSGQGHLRGTSRQKGSSGVDFGTP